MLSHYFTPEISPELEDAAIDDWVEILSAFDAEQIDRACKDYMRDQPRRRPTPGDIRARASTYRKEDLDRHRASLPPPPPEPDKPRVTAEMAERIMQQAGFTRELSNVLNRFPKAPTREAAFDRHEEVVSEPHWTHKATADQLEQLRKARIKAGMIQE